MRYNEPKRGLLSRLAEAGSAGLGIASNMAMPMYQQKMAQQRDQRDFDAEQQRFNQRMGQDESQFTRQLNAQNERARIDDWRTRASAGVNYGQPDPMAQEAAKIRMAAQFGLIPSGYKQPGDESVPKMPPNILGDANRGFGELLSKWQGDVVYNTETKDDPYDVKPNPSRGPEPTKAGYFNQNIAHTIPNLQQSYPQSFGPNAADSLYQGFTGEPRQPKTGPFTHVNTTPGAVVQMGDAPQPYDGNGTPEEYQQYLRDWQAAYQRRQR